MVLEINDIIQGLVLTPDAYNKNKKLKQLTIRVHTKANKPQIAQAVELLFNVKVDKVRTIIRKGKRKLLRKTRTEVVGPAIKKAIITLKEGYSLDLLGLGNTQQRPVVAEQEQNA